MSYTKLFSSIVTSTIWTEDDKTRIVWITMLAIANKHGEVQASIPGLARVSGVSVEAAEAAINRFLAPDQYSRTPDDEGRRIEKIEGGWQLLNHAKYRAMASKDEAVASSAIRQRRFRERKARNGTVTDSNALVTHRNGTVTHKRDIAEAEAEAEADTEAEKKKNKNGASALLPELKAYAVEIGLTEQDGESMFDHWESNGWKNGNNKVRCWKAGIRKWKANGWLPSQKQQTNGHKKPQQFAGMQEEIPLV
jgi:hypothetical protein